MLGIFALTVQSVQGAFMVMINHGISTGALFFLIGMIYERRHTRLIEPTADRARRAIVRGDADDRHVQQHRPAGTNGFIGEFLVLIGAFRTEPVLARDRDDGVIISAAYLLWAIQRILFNPLDKAENEHIPDLNRRELAMMLPLVAAIVWLGVYPAPVLRAWSGRERFVTTSSAARRSLPIANGESR
jgi:NADH-quinone oxidoreductase subunit M